MTAPKMPDPMLTASDLIAICNDACTQARIDYEKLEDGPTEGLCKAFVQLVAVTTHKHVLTRLYEIALYRASPPAGIETLDPNDLPKNREMLATYIAELALIATAARAMLHSTAEAIKPLANLCQDAQGDPNHWLAHADDTVVALHKRLADFDKTKEMSVERPAHVYTQETGRA